MPTTALEVSKRVAEKAQTLYTPVIWTGYSPQHLRAPEQGMGTITMRGETLRRILYDVAKSLIHHGFNRLIIVNGHTSNQKVLDEMLRALRYETGALIALFKCYGERDIGLIEDILENSPEETPGWHARRRRDIHHAGLRPSQRSHGDRAVDARAHSPAWLPSAFDKSDGTWDAKFHGAEQLYFPMDHDEFADHGVIGNPLRYVIAEKGDLIFERFADYLAEAVVDLRKAPVEVKDRILVMRILNRVLLEHDSP